jgi:S-adenosylmethionine:tRNA ribosyltransferase-isomerase
MRTQDFSFDLPEDLIAQEPPAERGRSRLMVLDRAARERRHRMVADLPDLLEPGALLVFNNSRVRKARLYGISKSSGATVEFLLLEKRDPHAWLAMASRSRRRRPGSRYEFPGGLEGEITGAEGEFRLLRFNAPVGEDWLDRHGHIPLPPYIKREDRAEDGDRYQTVYAAVPGSVAAPTAGLHFTRELLTRLEDRGIGTAFVTLHVGLGTFLPVRTEQVEDHRMHEESYTIADETAARIERAKAEGRPVVAVGTTSLRTLEAAWEDAPPAAAQTAPAVDAAAVDASKAASAGAGGRLRRGEGATSIFIYPGYTFKAVDALFTNFHTPQSTLLMLVSALADAKAGAFAGTKAGAFAGTKAGAFASTKTEVFAGAPDGREFILESYAEAVREGYRFFSYGDAMLIR